MLMNNPLRSIRNKIDTIQLGLLRYDDKKKKITLHVTAKANTNNTLTCTIADAMDLNKLANKKVSLVQKSEDDYLYISGEVNERVDANTKTLSINILKACWFVRKSKGSLSWLQEKHVYSILPEDDLGLAS
jgi:hypothetical protein